MYVGIYCGGVTLLCAGIGFFVVMGRESFFLHSCDGDFFEICVRRH